MTIPSLTQGGLTHTEVALIVYDFDGVMTDNRVIVSEDGTESVIVSRADGLGVSSLKHAGFRQVILSTESNPVVAARGRKLGIEVIQGCHDKLYTLMDYCEKNEISTQNVVFVGNDINDLQAMNAVGYAACPADASLEVRQSGALILSTLGGSGVIRELMTYFNLEQE